MKIARLFSYLAHPVIIPMVGVIILFRAVNWMGMLSMETRLYTYLAMAFFTILMPLSAMPILKSQRVISSYFMPTAEERKIPLLLASFLLLVCAFLLQKINTPMIFPLFINSSSVVILFCALISWKWKISTHMAGIAGLVGLVLGITLKWMIDLRLLLAVLILLSGLIGWARLKMQAHTPAQIYAGFGLGFTVVFLIVRFI